MISVAAGARPLFLEHKWVPGAIVQPAQTPYREKHLNPHTPTRGGGDPTAPFGGSTMSGNGREWGDYGFQEFLETKAILGYAPPPPKA